MTVTSRYKLSLQVSSENKDETGRQWFKIVLLVCVCVRVRVRVRVCVCSRHFLFWYSGIKRHDELMVLPKEKNNNFACFMSSVFEMHFDDALAQFAQSDASQPARSWRLGKSVHCAALSTCPVCSYCVFRNKMGFIPSKHNSSIQSSIP